LLALTLSQSEKLEKKVDFTGDFYVFGTLVEVVGTKLGTGSANTKSVARRQGQSKLARTTRKNESFHGGLDMLVLSRKVGQEIVIGDNVRITITKVSGNRVTLGVDAPDHVRILRGELEPVARSFEDPLTRSVDVLAQTVAMVVEGQSSRDTIPFVPSVAR